jgi:AcrR family transcriptional regulator
MTTAAGEGLGAPTRLDRRKARTRRALLDAARVLMVERGTTDVSIQQITDRADVGFGSFYNHFTTKTELFEAAVAEVLEEHGARLDEASAGLEDPAEVFAVGVRTTARLVDTHSVAAQVMVQAGLSYLTAEQGLAPRATRDLRLGLETGRFTVSSPHLGLVITAGCLLAYLQVRLHRPGYLTEDTPEELAERILVMLGVDAATARDVAHRPLPAAAPA